MREQLRLARGLLRFVVRHPAVHGDRPAALARALKWQFSRRSGAKPAVVEVGPTQLHCHPGSTGATGLLYVGLPEWGDMVFALRYLRAGDLFVDVGANIGAYSLLAGTWVPGVSLLAVEPDAEAAGRLEANLSLNHLHDVEVIRAAAGASDGSVSFTHGLDTVNRIAPEGEPQTVTVPLRRLDGMVGPRRPALIKIDVEGAELEALRGAEGLLTSAEPPSVIFELNESLGVGAEEVFAYLRGHGFQICTFDVEANVVMPLDERHPALWGNALAIRDVAAANERVRTSQLAAQPETPVRVRVRPRLK